MVTHQPPNCLPHAPPHPCEIVPSCKAGGNRRQLGIADREEERPESGREEDGRAQLGEGGQRVPSESPCGATAGRASGRIEGARSSVASSERDRAGATRRESAARSAARGRQSGSAHLRSGRQARLREDTCTHEAGKQAGRVRARAIGWQLMGRALRTQSAAGAFPSVGASCPSAGGGAPRAGARTDLVAPAGGSSRR